MNYEQRITALEQAVAKLQPLPQIDEDAAVRAKWQAIPQEEKDAGWWRLETYWVTLSQIPCLVTKQSRLGIIKTAAHPDNDRHARKKLEWNKVKDAGTHERWVLRAGSGNKAWQRLPNDYDLWHYGECYEIHTTAKKKLIDMSKLPVGAMTNFGRFMGRSDSCLAFIFKGNYSCSVPYGKLRIVPMTQWEVLQEGDEIPEGLIADTVHFPAKAAIVYRITGILDGYTDDPSEA